MAMAMRLWRCRGCGNITVMCRSPATSAVDFMSTVVAANEANIVTITAAATTTTHCYATRGASRVTVTRRRGTTRRT